MYFLQAEQVRIGGYLFFPFELQFVTLDALLHDRISFMNIEFLKGMKSDFRRSVNVKSQ